MSWAWLFLAALSHAADSGCKQIYRNSYYEDAGITKPDWDAMCDRGEDPKEFHARRYVERQSEHGKKDADRAVVKEFLDLPLSHLRPEDKNALADVDPENLEGKQKEDYLAWREDMLARGLGAPPGRSSCKKGVYEKMLRDIKVWKLSGHEEITWDECDWLSKTIECTFIEMEKALQFHMVYDCKKKEYRCFLHPKDPMMAYIGSFRAGKKAPDEVGGTAFFGISSMPSCKKGSFDEFLKPTDTR
jgi:hypothetical protein